MSWFTSTPPTPVLDGTFHGAAGLQSDEACRLPFEPVVERLSDRLGPHEIEQITEAPGIGDVIDQPHCGKQLLRVQPRCKLRNHGSHITQVACGPYEADQVHGSGFGRGNTHVCQWAS